MRRWNGWGDETTHYPLHRPAARLIEEWAGEPTPPHDASFADVVKAVPVSRLPDHPLISTEAAERARHARGQSLPDWIALRGGRIPAFPDGVAYPMSGEDVRDLIRYASANGVRLIPYGGGTSVVGHINPLPGDAPVLTVDLGRMNRLIQFDEASHLATFGAGISRAGPGSGAPRARLHARPFPAVVRAFHARRLDRDPVQRAAVAALRAHRAVIRGRQSRDSGRHARSARRSRRRRQGRICAKSCWDQKGASESSRRRRCASRRCPEHEEFHGIFFPTFEQGMAAARAMVQARLPLSMLRLSTAIETQTTLALAGHERLIGWLEKYSGGAGRA